MNKILTTILIVSVVYLGVGFALVNKEKAPTASGTVLSFYPTNAVSSSTTFSLTTASQRLLATTTGSTRIFASIQTKNCTAGGTLFTRVDGDKAATVAYGPFLLASSTVALQFGTFDNPVSGNSLQGIMDAGTCSVVVTEWLK